MATYPAMIGVDVSSAENALQATRRIQQGYSPQSLRATVRLIVDNCETEWEVDIDKSSLRSSELFVNLRFTNPQPGHEGTYEALIRRKHGVWYAEPMLVFTPDEARDKDELACGPDTVLMPVVTI